MRIVSFEHGFHFSLSDTYTGLTATSLEDFSSKLETIDVNSILFHYPRGDFQRWIDDTLGDKQLANQMCFIKTEISGEELRGELMKMVQKRVKDLKGLKWVEEEGI